ncbi:polyketide synthase [Micromonospora inyonensis]|uniref:Beta-ketoacyl synthase, C-terminal domain n=1 Tax=Micromonospora inyonensis TaxID=47866 RepID=A0A1C6RPV4_9ACTN|nr:polyketide synthase [Micromonospora inyonensis]SCL19236.1 Beta-ketoacyl synthase, C-terminal domain [Micromonospora inyonensis]
MRYEPIAIIGIGCRYPGGIDDPRSFWEVIAAGTDAIGEIPPDRWRADAHFDSDPATPGRMFVRQGGFLRSPVDRFDAGFFGMAPREAAALDPQQRLLLEVTWEAFEDAGLPPSSTAGANVGAYIGGFTFDAATLQLADANRHLVSTATPTGVSMTILAARLSYTFDWRGPSLTVDTACSSSLVALHHACTALARGECDLAVAGGVNVMVNPVTTILMSKGQFLSPDGRCKSFDHRANGYGRAEGAGVVVLKPLAAAERDGDRVYAVVRGSAVNQDGRTPGITVPSAEAQRSVIRQTCRAGGVDPRSIGYFEAHGTGTAVGDPIEATAIGEVLDLEGWRHPLAVQLVQRALHDDRQDLRQPRPGVGQVNPHRTALPGQDDRPERAGLDLVDPPARNDQLEMLVDPGEQLAAAACLVVGKESGDALPLLADRTGGTERQPVLPLRPLPVGTEVADRPEGEFGRRNRGELSNIPGGREPAFSGIGTKPWKVIGRTTGFCPATLNR